MRALAKVAAAAAAGWQHTAGFLWIFSFRLRHSKHVTTRGNKKANNKRETKL